MVPKLVPRYFPLLLGGPRVEPKDPPQANTGESLLRKRTDRF